MGAILAVVIAAILIMVAAEIVANVSTSMPAVTGAANTTITNITTGTYNGLQLMTVLPVVLAAAAIISAVVGGFMILRSRQ
jgi:malonyl CoA-acyl carrier protein transacylase